MEIRITAYLSPSEVEVFLVLCIQRESDRESGRERERPCLPASPRPRLPQASQRKFQETKKTKNLEVVLEIIQMYCNLQYLVSLTHQKNKKTQGFGSPGHQKSAVVLFFWWVKLTKYCKYKTFK